jgi:hypothetical protein
VQIEDSEPLGSTAFENPLFEQSEADQYCLIDLLTFIRDRVEVSLTFAGQQLPPQPGALRGGGAFARAPIAHQNQVHSLERRDE